MMQYDYFCPKYCKKKNNHENCKYEMLKEINQMIKKIEKKRQNKKKLKKILGIGTAASILTLSIALPLTLKKGNQETKIIVKEEDYKNTQEFFIYKTSKNTKLTWTDYLKSLKTKPKNIKKAMHFYLKSKNTKKSFKVILEEWNKIKGTL